MQLASRELRRRLTSNPVGLKTSSRRRDGGAGGQADGEDTACGGSLVERCGRPVRAREQAGDDGRRSSRWRSARRPLIEDLERGVFLDEELTVTSRDVQLMVGAFDEHLGDNLIQDALQSDKSDGD